MLRHGALPMPQCFIMVNFLLQFLREVGVKAHTLFVTRSLSGERVKIIFTTLTNFSIFTDIYKYKQFKLWKTITKDSIVN